MGTKYSKVEIKALLDKEENPEKDIMCPRCGKLLIFTEFNNSHLVKCQTEDCLISRCRGL